MAINLCRGRTPLHVRPRGISLPHHPTTSVRTLDRKLKDSDRGELAPRLPPTLAGRRSQNNVFWEEQEGLGEMNVSTPYPPSLHSVPFSPVPLTLPKHIATCRNERAPMRNAGGGTANNSYFVGEIPGRGSCIACVNGTGPNP